MDEDYQTDPSSAAAFEWNSAWEYDLGTNFSASVPWSNAPNRKPATPFLNNFSGQNQKAEIYGHYLYTNQRRSNPPQYDLYITDLNNPPGSQHLHRRNSLGQFLGLARRKHRGRLQR